MNERKDQTTFFERALIEDPAYAETIYENENLFGDGFSLYFVRMCIYFR